MADPTRRRPDEEEFDVPEEERERGVAEEDDEFEDTEDLDEEEDEEDIDSPKGMTSDRGFTSEVGSEGGSQGDLETRRRKPRVMQGSEATTTAEADRRSDRHDRRAGGGPEGPRR